jgi:hypothetical protein
MTTTHYTGIEELAEWAPYDESGDPTVVTESDIDIAADIADEDEFAEHQRAEADNHRY